MTQHEKVLKILDDKKLDYKVITLKEKSFTVEDVIRNADEHIRPEEVVKTIMVVDGEGNHYAVMLPGKSKVDFKKLEKLLERRVFMAKAHEVELAAGVQAGAVCPVILDHIPVLVDHDVFRTRRINFGSCDLYKGIEINSEDLKKIIEVHVTDVTLE